MANNSIIIIDHGWQNFQAQIRDLDNKVVDIGLQSGTNSDVLDYAFWNEFGTKHIPERPFMRSTLTRYENELLDKSKEILRNIANGANAITQLNILGLFAETKHKQNLMSGNFDPNSPNTIRIKGSSKPLIDTAQMLGLLRFLVRDR